MSLSNLWSNPTLDRKNIKIRGKVWTPHDILFSIAASSCGSCTRPVVVTISLLVCRRYEFINIYNTTWEGLECCGSVGGGGCTKTDLQTSSAPEFTKPQTDRHITGISLCRVVVTSFMAPRIADLPNIHPPPPSPRRSQVSVSQPLNAALSRITCGV